MQLEARDKRALIGGAVVVTAVLAYLLWPSGAANQSSVELVAADQRKGPAPSAAPAIPVQTVPVPPPAAPPAAVPEGLVLTGVTGSGAIFGFADGNQRYVARGREIAPGLKLQGVALRHVILAGGATSYRLGFGGAAVPIQAPAVAAPLVGGPAPQLVVPGAGRNALGGPMITQAAQQQTVRQYLSGLEPRRSRDRVTGWTVKPGAELAAMQQAGLQPGDVLLTVNGEAVSDQEQVAGLPQQIANSHRVEFGFERNGQRMTRTIEVNPRR
jgi:general secretion pathway protein C